MKKLVFLICLIGFVASGCYAQKPAKFKDGIRTEFVQPDTLSTVQRDALTPKLGTLVYHKDTGISRWEEWDGSAWGELGGSVALPNREMAYGNATSDGITSHTNIQAYGSLGWIKLNDGGSNTSNLYSDRLNTSYVNDKSELYYDKLRYYNTTDGSIYIKPSAGYTDGVTLFYPPLTANDTIATLDADQTITGTKTFDTPTDGGLNSTENIISINTSNNVFGVVSENSGLAGGIYSNNTGGGIGLSVDNQAGGNGVYIFNRNTATDDALEINNASDSDGIYVNNQGAGDGIYVLNDTGTGMKVSAKATATGNNYEGWDFGVKTFSVDKLGGVIGTKFDLQGDGLSVMLNDGTTALTSSLSGGLSNIVEDLTPQLGGDLVLGGNDITGTGNIFTTGAVVATNAVGQFVSDEGGAGFFDNTSGDGVSFRETDLSYTDSSTGFQQKIQFDAVLTQDETVNFSDLGGGSVEGVDSTGTLLGGDYIATIGDPDSDANMVINQATETITITTGSPVVLSNGANLNGNDLINVPTPVNPTDGANKAYVDASIPSNLFDPQPLVDAYEFVLTDADGVIYYHSDFGVTKTASIADDATTDFPTGSVLQVQQHTSTLSPITVDFLQGVGNRVAIITDTNANKDLGVSFIKMADDYWNVRGDYTYTTYSPPSATNYYDLANAANFDTEVNASTGFTAVGYMTVASVADTDGASAYSIEAARTTGTGGAINVQTSISGLTNGATYTVTIRAKKDITSGDDPYYTILNATGSGVQSITTTSYAEYVSTVTMTDTTMTILFYLESDVAGNKVQISSIKVED